MTRLRIVHVTTFYPPHAFGGDGVHVQRLAEAQLRRGHEVEVVWSPGAFRMLDRRGAGLATDRPSAAGEAPGLGPALHPTTTESSRLEPLLVQQTGGPVLSRRRLLAALAPEGGGGPDVIHYHNVSLVGGVGVLAMGEAVKLYTTHEYWLVCPTHLLFRYEAEPCTRRTCLRCTLHAGRPPQWWRYTRRRDAAVARLDRAIYPSAVARENYRRQGLAMPGEVLHHFLPEAYLRRAGELGARRPDVEPYFLYVGRLDAVKGVDRLLEHFVGSERPARLLVVGDGPLGPELRARYGDHPSIGMLGTLAPGDLGSLYRDALALILPSAGHEIFGLVVAEALAHGTPAIVSHLCGAAEVVEQSGAGAVFASPAQLDDALERIVRDPAARDAMGRRGQEFAVDRLGESAYLDRYERLVEEVREARRSAS